MATIEDTGLIVALLLTMYKLGILYHAWYVNNSHYQMDKTPQIFRDKKFQTILYRGKQYA